MKAHGRPQKRRQYLTAAFVIKEIINIKNEVHCSIYFNYYVVFLLMQQ